MKKLSKTGMFDTDPSLKGVRLESGTYLIYANEQDQTINSIWRRSIL